MVSVVPVLPFIVALFPLMVSVEPAVIPVKVYPLDAVSVTCAVYAVLDANVVPALGDQVTEPTLKFGVGVVIDAEVLRVSPVTGFCTVIAAAVSTVSVALN